MSASRALRPWRLPTTPAGPPWPPETWNIAQAASSCPDEAILATRAAGVAYDSGATLQMIAVRSSVCGPPSAKARVPAMSPSSTCWAEPAR